MDDFIEDIKYKCNVYLTGYSNMKDFLEYIKNKYNDYSIKKKKNRQSLFKELVEYAINNEYTVEYTRDPEVLTFSNSLNLIRISFNTTNQIVIHLGSLISFAAILTKDESPVIMCDYTYPEQDLKTFIGILSMDQKCYLALYGVPV